MKWQTKAIAALAALSMLWGPVRAATPSISTSTAAKLTEARGSIFKRGFVDWTKDAWGNPESASVGDILEEGMQLGTGDKSWAQVTWPNVTTRAWANTVFAVAPNQRLVYLMGGEMLFNLDKHRKNKKDYVLWTKVLQARIRGTTVLVQATKELSRITVLEGCVDVMNRLDRSVIRVTPGVVYEIRTPSIGHGSHIQPIHRMSQEGIRRHDRSSADKPAARTTEDNELQDRTSIENQDPTSSTITAGEDSTTTSGTSSQSKSMTISSGTQDSLQHEICSQTQLPLSVFETPRSTTSLYVANADNLREHPLVNKFDTPLTSLPLVEGCLSKLPPVCHESIPHVMGPAALENNLLTSNTHKIEVTTGLPGQHLNPGNMLPQNIASNQTDSVLLQNAEIVRVPTAMDYKVGPLVGIQIPLPAGATHNFPPSGLIGPPANVDFHQVLPTEAHQTPQVLPPGLEGHNVHNLVSEQAHRPSISNELLGPNMMTRGDLNSVRNINPHNAIQHLPSHLSNSAMMGPNMMTRPDMGALRNLVPINIDRTFDRPPLMIAPNLIDSSNNFINPNLPPK